MLPGGLTRLALGASPCEGELGPLSIIDMELQAQLSFKSAGKVLSAVGSNFNEFTKAQVRPYQGDRSQVDTLLNLSFEFNQFFPAAAKLFSSFNEAAFAHDVQGFSKRTREVDWTFLSSTRAPAILSELVRLRLTSFRRWVSVGCPRLPD